MEYLFAFLLVALGLVAIIAPKAAWFLSEGWKFKDAEPSDMAIIMMRIGGVLMIVVAVVILIVG